MFNKKKIKELEEKLEFFKSLNEDGKKNYKQLEKEFDIHVKDVRNWMATKQILFRCIFRNMSEHEAIERIKHLIFGVDYDEGNEERSDKE